MVNVRKLLLADNGTMKGIAAKCRVIYIPNTTFIQLLTHRKRVNYIYDRCNIAAADEQR